MSELINIKSRRTVLDPIALILASTLADSTKAKYTQALSGFLESIDLSAERNAEALAADLTGYVADLSNSRRAHLKSAISFWAKRMATHVKLKARTDNVQSIQAILLNLEGLMEVIEVNRPNGQKLHMWLSQAQVRQLLRTCDSSIRGQRDKIVLGLLTGAGLRRRELAKLTFADITMRPVGEKFRTVLQVVGKGEKSRSIPISDRLSAAIDQWGVTTGDSSGRVARATDQRHEIQESISTVGIFDIVQKAGAAIGHPDLAPHDLRRTYAQLGYEAGVPITQISQLLGHASVETTQRYLNLEVNLETTAGDFIPFE